jgi:probable rRNA maturation factor
MKKPKPASRRKAKLVSARLAKAATPRRMRTKIRPAAAARQKTAPPNPRLLNLQLSALPSRRRQFLTKRDTHRLIKILNQLWIERAATAINLEVAFVDEKKIRALHQQFLQNPSETDVMTFDLGATPEARRIAAIAICVPVAQHYAERYGVSLRAELLRLIIHGALHLLGFDDHTPAEKQRMRYYERKLLQSFY